MPSQAGVALTWSTTVFWVQRLVVQWSVSDTARWCGTRFETVVHVVFSFACFGLTALFVLCGTVQLGPML
jgi:hypothetical protein